ncbi:M18 family aminopeptidase [Bradyrhizobium vignae]|nr:M18 family aminopeptidase [Bradyrhizobium vignae]
MQIEQAAKVVLRALIETTLEEAFPDERWWFDRSLQGCGRVMVRETLV